MLRGNGLLRRLVNSFAVAKGCVQDRVALQPNNVREPRHKLAMPVVNGFRVQFVHTCVVREPVAVFACQVPSNAQAL